MAATAQTPQHRAIYTARLRQLTEAAARLTRQDQYVANARLATFVAAVVLGLVCWSWHGLSWAWLGVPGGAFMALVFWHGHILESLQNVTTRQRYYQAGLQRMDQIVPADAPLGPNATMEHPFACDLDLFGPDALFGLMCTAQTLEGQERLAHWLMHPANREEILARQDGVREMQERCTLREDLVELTQHVRLLVSQKNLEAWARAPALLPGAAWEILLYACNIAFVVSGVGAWQQWWGPVPVIAVFCGQMLLARWLREPVLQVVAALQQPGRSLSVLAALIARVMREPMASPYAVRWRQALSRDGEASSSIASLARLCQLYEAHLNQVFAIFAMLSLWVPHCAFFVERWRRRCGPRITGWLEAVGELEALISLGGYAFEHPEDVFAEILDPHLGPVFDAEQLGHPLVATDVCVRNDVVISKHAPLLIVSGSNMSGKSTLLRSVGAATVLALAGAPVRAQRMRLSVLAVGATLVVQDSIHTGTSRFYAELKRLRQVLDLTDGPIPLFFLLDEILHGTNSHDRMIGAAAVLETFLKRGAIGMVTTHDLALTDKASELGGRNVHFVDDLLDDKLHFDYRMRQGVVNKSNALALMKAVGLYQAPLQ